VIRVRTALRGSRLNAVAELPPAVIDSRKILNLIRVRARRALQILRLDARSGLRGELLTMDYVLPLIRRRTRSDLLHLRTRSKAAAGMLYFGRESFAVDRVAYFGIFLERWYRGDYGGAIVVDVGAHKGYYGAFAMLEGAEEVRSYEPESSNFAALEWAAASFDKRWIVQRAAIGSTSGEVKLHVTAESAAHSVVRNELEGPRRTLRSENVAVIGMRDVLAQASLSGHPLIVKIDAEGAECDIVLGTPVEIWRLVDHIFLEVHDFAPCSTAAIVDHLQDAGLEVALHEVDDKAELLGLNR
jgi:FkbM family methyltransferase